MKKLVLLFLPLLLLTSCQKDEITLKAVIQNFGDDKVHLNSADYAIFDNGDQVSINGRTFSVRVSSTDGSASVANVPVSDEYISVFPANNSNKVVLGQEQVYEEVTINGTRVQKINAPMAAKDRSLLHYKNLCSLLEVVVTAPVPNFDVLSITVTCPDNYLYGTYNVNFDGPAPSISSPNTTSGDSYGHTVTLNCNRYTINNMNDSKAFYVVLPPFVTSSTLSVFVQAHSTYERGDKTGKLFYHNTQRSESFTLPANKIVTGASVPNQDAYTVVDGLEGAGTELDPYKLYSYNDLFYAASVVNSGEIDNVSTYRTGEPFTTGYFRVMADIDCGTNVVTPIGTSNHRFEGTFDGTDTDGNRHTVTYNKLADIGGNVGLLGEVKGGATIKNVTVAGQIHVEPQFGKQVNVIGGIVAGVNNDPNTDVTYITNCCNNASIASMTQLTINEKRSAHVGGILGSAWVTTTNNNNLGSPKVVVDNCTNTGSIYGISSSVANCGTGGIVGTRIQSVQLIINNCKNEGTVVGNSTNSNSGVGGIIGFIKSESRTQECKIVNCENIASVSCSTTASVGGICGFWQNTGSNVAIANCVNHGSVSRSQNNGNGCVGGILGQDKTDNLPILNCYSDGILSGSEPNHRGGIVGWSNHDGMTNCYYLPQSGVVAHAGNAQPSNSQVRNVAGNQIGSGEGQTPYTGNSGLLGILNTWVGNNNPATPAYSTWTEVSGKPELSSLHPTSAGAKRRR